MQSSEREWSAGAEQLIEDAKKIAVEFKQSSIEVPHLLLADIQHLESSLKQILSPEHSRRVRLALQAQARRGSATGNKLDPRASEAIGIIRQALVSGEGPPCLLNVLARRGSGPISYQEFVGAAIDYRPHPIAPLLEELEVSSVQWTWPAEESIEPVIAGRTRCDEVHNLFRDLTREAKEGRLPEFVGREHEIRQLIRILRRKHSNNAILVGDPNVGKTAIVEGLARQIAADEVPEWLKGYKILQLDLARMVAGTKYRGEFESRLEAALEQLKASGKFLLFIDEIHQLNGLGRADGSMDAGNILKPMLARGELRCIGATTQDEFAAIEADAALARRFRKVIVPSMPVEETRALLSHVTSEFEKHHGVRFEETVLGEILRLADSVWPNGASPGREVDLLDEVAALVSTMGEALVTSGHVATLVAMQAGFPAERVRERPKDRLERAMRELRHRVIGQNPALNEIERRLRSIVVGIGLAAGPRACLHLFGPPGVGKGLTATIIAQSLFHHEALVRIDLASCRDEACASRLLGATRGHIGYERGGELTEPVRKRPNAVVLLEHVEQAHPIAERIIQELLQNGILTDNHGRTVSFRSTMVVLTETALAASSDRWAAWSGPSISFQKTSVEDLDRLIEQEIGRTVRAFVNCSGTSIRPETTVEFAHHPDHVQCRLAEGQEEKELELAASVWQQLRTRIGNRPAAVASIIQLEIGSRLSKYVLESNLLPQKIRITDLERD